MYMKCLIWIKKTIRGLEIFHWKCAFWFLIFFLFLHLLAYSYTSFLKIQLNPRFLVVNIFSSFFHTFSTPCHDNTSSTLPPPIFISSSTFGSEWFVTKTPFLRIAFVINRLPSLGTSSFCTICLKISRWVLW